MVNDGGLEPKPADDLLHGCGAIAAFLGVSRRRAYDLLERGKLPAGHLGAIWIGSKRRLREHLDKVTAGPR